MEKHCIVATNNPGKVRELKAIFEAESIPMLALCDLGITFVPGENGTTFEANAMQKATETAAFLAENGHGGGITLADDSGLVIDALDGAPGVDSALFMGADTPYEQRCAKIIETMSAVPDGKRSARFVCVIACILPCGKAITSRAALEGEIARKPSGAEGFGYDPIFFVPKFGKTMAEISREEKNKISHRGQALRQMIELIKSTPSGG
ncbi:MAG: RdgB/HAM1 family non-canonical purine NTP pyrophosphatase [Defluviitaleaceae bacterium]|nr:RdgB/HAM1 family non-canonical purine NTP pyrophosphatase [Defluviitaleaceae bacterium]